MFCSNLYFMLCFIPSNNYYLTVLHLTQLYSLSPSANLCWQQEWKCQYIFCDVFYLMSCFVPSNVCNVKYHICHTHTASLHLPTCPYNNNDRAYINYVVISNVFTVSYFQLFIIVTISHLSHQVQLSPIWQLVVKTTIPELLYLLL